MPEFFLNPQSMTRKELMYSEFPFLFAKKGDRVKAHLNLGVKWKSHGMKTWSVKDMRGSKTIGHVNSMVLKDCKFIVRGAGNKKVRGGGPKDVHAFVEGVIVSADPPHKVSGFRGSEVKYNPHLQYRMFCVHDPDTEPNEDCGFNEDYTRPITQADLVYLDTRWKVWAKNPK